MSDKLGLYKAKIAQHYKQIIKSNNKKYDFNFIMISMIVLLMGMSLTLILLSIFGVFIFQLLKISILFPYNFINKSWSVLCYQTQ